MQRPRSRSELRGKMAKAAKTVVPEDAGDTAVGEREKKVDTSEGDGKGSALRLLGCFIGLQVSYLTWGYLQEKVMTKQYRDGEKFPSAMFCVLANRLFAIVTAFILVLATSGNPNFSSGRKLLAFAPPAISNTLSSFGQYQALRYVAFPLQTITKSTKVIPVMLMGKYLNGRTYKTIEYCEAALISVGVAIFAFERKSISLSDGMADLNISNEQLLGALMLVVYVVSDSFTSQYQSRIYKQNPEVSQFEMMLYVNVWAAALSMVSLVMSGQMSLVVAFLAKNPEALWDNMLIGVTSATGQCFIFYTIKTFGPVTFTIIMTTRQMFSIVISMVMFGHPLMFKAFAGACLVFATLFNRSYRSWKKAQQDKQESA
eukprot:TRINITY_DN10406_c0_g1_i1.p1 TRINITY_DN10406_c0_g1~~TRINITY_DN10406_c0_g1_i1.p1  ORF type:complete len:372 (-),score=76.78 TRINITY_DN10406_c0_g1_i1:190-1305(-)